MSQRQKEETVLPSENLKPSTPVTYDEKKALIKAYLEPLQSDKTAKPRKKRVSKASR